MLYQHAFGLFDPKVGKPHAEGFSLLFAQVLDEQTLWHIQLHGQCRTVDVGLTISSCLLPLCERGRDAQLLFVAELSDARVLAICVCLRQKVDRKSTRLNSSHAN